MQSGTLNRRIEIQAQSTTRDAAGQQIQTWSPVYRCWASIDIQASQLLYSTAEFVSKVTYRITIRWSYSTVVKPDMLVVYKEPRTGVIHTYNIEALLNTKQKNRELVLMCYELNGAE